MFLLIILIFPVRLLLRYDIIALNLLRHPLVQATKRMKGKYRCRWLYLDNICNAILVLIIFIAQPNHHKTSYHLRYAR